MASEGLSSKKGRGLTEAELSIRGLTFDWYNSKPVRGLDVTSSSYMGVSELRMVPILRIFGRTSEGKKACLHLHGTFPYLYVPVPDDWPKARGELETNVRKLAFSLEEVLRLKGRQAAAEGSRVAIERQHILKAQVVRGVPFYGLHLKERLFVKIYLLDPSQKSSAAAVLLGGVVMDRVFQPHNAHIPYLLQCMVDYNIVGMGLIDLKLVQYRQVPCFLLDSDGQRVRLPVDLERRWRAGIHGTRGDINDCPKMSISMVEVDATVEAIMNKDQVSTRQLSATDRDSVKVVSSLEYVLEQVRDRGRGFGLDTPTGSLSGATRSQTPLDSFMSLAQREAALLVADREKSLPPLQLPPSSRVESLESFPAVSEHQMMEDDAGQKGDFDLQKKDHVKLAKLERQQTQDYYSRLSQAYQASQIMPGSQDCANLTQGDWELFKTLMDLKDVEDEDVYDAQDFEGPEDIDERDEEEHNCGLSQFDRFQEEPSEYAISQMQQEVLMWEEQVSGLEQDLAEIAGELDDLNCRGKVACFQAGPTDGGAADVPGVPLDVPGVPLDVPGVPLDVPGVPLEGGEGWENDGMEIGHDIDECVQRGGSNGDDDDDGRISQVDGEEHEGRKEKREKRDMRKGKDERKEDERILALNQKAAARRDSLPAGARKFKTHGKRQFSALTIVPSDREQPCADSITGGGSRKFPNAPRDSVSGNGNVAAESCAAVDGSAGESSRSGYRSSSSRRLADVPIGHRSARDKMIGSTGDDVGIEAGFRKECEGKRQQGSIRGEHGKRLSSSSVGVSTSSEITKRMAPLQRVEKLHQKSPHHQSQARVERKSREVHAQTPTQIHGAQDDISLGWVSASGDGDDANDAAAGTSNMLIDGGVAVGQSDFVTAVLLLPQESPDRLVQSTAHWRCQSPVESSMATWKTPLPGQPSPGVFLQSPALATSPMPYVKPQTPSVRGTARHLEGQGRVEEPVDRGQRPPLHPLATPKSDNKARHAASSPARAIGSTSGREPPTPESPARSGSREGPLATSVTPAALQHCTVNAASPTTPLSNDKEVARANSRTPRSRRDASLSFASSSFPINLSQEEQSLGYMSNSGGKLCDGIDGGGAGAVMADHASQEGSEGMRSYRQHRAGGSEPEKNSLHCVADDEIDMVIDETPPGSLALGCGKAVLRLKRRAPSWKIVCEAIQYESPYWSKPRDVEKPFKFADKLWHIKSHDVAVLPPFVTSQTLSLRASADGGIWQRHLGAGQTVLVPIKRPPSRKKIESFLRKEKRVKENVAEQSLGAYGGRELEIDSAGRQHFAVAAVGEKDEDVDSQDTIGYGGTYAAIKDQLERPSSPKYDEAFLSTLVLPSQQQSSAWNNPHFTQLNRCTSNLRGKAQAGQLLTRSALSGVSHEGNDTSTQGAKTRQARGCDSGRNATEVQECKGKNEGEEDQHPQEEAHSKVDDARHATRDEYELTILSIEILAANRLNFRPDPQKDKVLAVCWAEFEMGAQPGVAARSRGVIALVSHESDTLGMPRDVYETKCLTEEDLFNAVEAMIVTKDPDMLVGFEVQQGSLGYLLQRATFLSIDLNRKISRCPGHPSIFENRANIYHEQHSAGLKICGRELINVWRICRNEVKLPMYGYSTVCEKVLNRKEEHYTFQTLNAWYSGVQPPGGDPAGGRPWSARLRRKALCHVLRRAWNTIDLLEAMDMIVRTCELGRVFGIDFNSVISRGSQYRVESMMLRLAITQNYVLISPSSQQVKGQDPISCIPLVKEPDSAFYLDPVCVLDFRSLYPSVVIAKNICYSTCMGNLKGGNGKATLGVDMTYKRERGILAAHLDGGSGFVSANGVAFVSATHREGILPRLLREILEARVMVKKVMKVAKDKKDNLLYRKLNARQFALKLIANVTYGYTSASASGRMPCIDVADSIVQTGREALETVIRLVNETREWGAEVVYGDTDSLFVKFEGKTVKEAFALGNEIVARVAKMFPSPMMLELEKVYFPCFMIAKKRYVGYKYESEHQMIPALDAKGIEMVRRDSCGLVVRAQEEVIRALFDSRGDVSRVKEVMLSIMKDVVGEKINISEFIFAKEVRAGGYKGTEPPAARIDRLRKLRDARAGALWAERVPYVVVAGVNGARLIDIVQEPTALAGSGGMFKINSRYYIEKGILPSIERLLNLLGADPRRWYREMPRAQRSFSITAAAQHALATRDGKKRTIDHFFKGERCVVCDSLCQTALCSVCTADSQKTVSVLMHRRNVVGGVLQRIQTICKHCTGCEEGARACTSIECSVFFDRRKAEDEFKAAESVRCGLDLAPKDLDW